MAGNHRLTTPWFLDCNLKKYGSTQLGCIKTCSIYLLYIIMIKNFSFALMFMISKVFDL